VLDAHLAASEDLRQGLDLVLWPENTIDVDRIEGTEADRLLAELARRVDATVIAGVTEEEDDDRFSNSSVVWSPSGEIVDDYVKVRRVPFGEYVPGRGFFSKLGDLSALPRDAVPGTEKGLLDTPVGRLGIAISYEVFFSDRARGAVRRGGRMLLVPTNASSFTTSQMPTQELAAARLRAWETGRWVLQAAPTGFTAVIDPDGRVRQMTDLGEREVVYQRVPLRTGLTPYARFGDWPVLLVTALLLVIPSGRWRARSRRASGRSASDDDRTSPDPPR
jgi:apolipoprotein N-acyltransferase